MNLDHSRDGWTLNGTVSCVSVVSDMFTMRIRYTRPALPLRTAWAHQGHGVTPRFGGAVSTLKCPHLGELFSRYKYFMAQA